MSLSAAPGASGSSSRTATTHSIAIGSANPAGASASMSHAYCQMPNHVHLILTPEDGEGLALALSRTRLYAGFVNARARQTGLFQGRFGSVALNEDHLMNAARYVALNPVRARLAPRAEDWPHSSVRAHLAGRDDGLVSVKPLKRPRAAFRRPYRRRARRGRLRPHQAQRADRPPVRLGGVRRGDREKSRPRPRPGQTGPETAGAAGENIKLNFFVSNHVSA